MIDIETLREYQEWRAGNEGKKVDVSPEAFALQKAIQGLLDMYVRLYALEDLESAVESVYDHWKALNAPTD